MPCFPFCSCSVLLSVVFSEKPGNPVRPPGDSEEETSTEASSSWSCLGFETLIFLFLFLAILVFFCGYVLKGCKHFFFWGCYFGSNFSAAFSPHLVFRVFWAFQSMEPAGGARRSPHLVCGGLRCHDAFGDTWDWLGGAGLGVCRFSRDFVGSNDKRW